MKTSSNASADQKLTRNRVEKLNALMGKAGSQIQTLHENLKVLADLYAASEQELREINRSLSNDDGSVEADLRKLQSLMSMNLRTVKALTANTQRIHGLKNCNVIVS